LHFHAALGTRGQPEVQSGVRAADPKTALIERSASLLDVRDNRRDQERDPWSRRRCLRPPVPSPRFALNYVILGAADRHGAAARPLATQRVDEAEVLDCLDAECRLKGSGDDEAQAG
jgi:hypothetical protein